MGVSNVLTVFRIFCVPLFVLSLVYYDKIWEATPFLIFCVASFTDVLDGAIALLFRQKTPLGAILDPLADKILLNAAFISLSIPNSFTKISPFSFPLYVPAVVVSRDIILITGIFIFIKLKHRFEIKPTVIGKICTFLQVLSVGLVLLGSGLSPLGWKVATIWTIISGFDYLIRGFYFLTRKSGKYGR
ncbi:hypothetical protein B9J78_04060 [bacterium Unc6]|nr:hypothetical protein [bacterium Unc6]